MFAVKKYGWVGFDIGAASVKSAQVVRRDGGFRLRSASIVLRREKWSAARMADDQPHSSADEVRCAASLNESVRGSTAAAMAPSALCETLSLTAPSGKRGSQADLRQALEAELQRPLRDHVLGSWPVGLQPGKINAAAAPRPWCDRICSDLSAAGWDCQLIDVLPWALARAVTMADPTCTKRTVAALDWGYSHATMVLVYHGAPSLIRPLKGCSFSGVLEAIASGLRISERDAEAILRKQGLRTGDGNESQHISRALRPQGLIEELLSEKLCQLTREIQRTLGFWRGAARGQTVEKLILFGGGGALGGVNGRLSEALRVPVEAWGLQPDSLESERNLPPHCLLGSAAGLSALAWEGS